MYPESTASLADLVENLTQRILRKLEGKGWLPVKQLRKWISAKDARRRYELSEEGQANPNASWKSQEQKGRDLLLPRLMERLSGRCESKEVTSGQEIRLANTVAAGVEPRLALPDSHEEVPSEPCADNSDIKDCISDCNELMPSEVVPTPSGPVYTGLEPDVVDLARSAANRIRERVKNTIASVVEIGRELTKVKAALPHGRWGKWLHEEFGWTQRTATNMMAVADRFGANLAIISQTQLQPTAAYLLAAGSVPEAAIDKAVERAGKGERITVKVAKVIVADAREANRKPGPKPDAKWVKKQLHRCLARWEEDTAKFAELLREFANDIPITGK
jgi:hypothetical protein